MKKALTAEAIHLSRGFFKHPFVRAIEKEFGFKGSKLVLDILIETTEKGFEAPYCREFRDRIAQRNSVSERLVDMVSHRMIKNGFLDQSKYDVLHVVAIPSVNILINKDDEGNNLPYYFINPSKNSVSSEETMVNSEETRNNMKETPIYSEQTPNNTELFRNITE